MNAQMRRRWPIWLLFAIILSAIGVGSFVLLRRGHSQEQPAAEIVQERGGRVVMGRTVAFTSSPQVIGVDLTGVTIDAELMDTLRQFTGLTRLTLDKATLPLHVGKWFGMLPRLESLSLATSNVSDDDLSQLPSALQSLSLNGTAVTDKCMSVVSTLRALTNLDITRTAITAVGVKSVQTIRTLKTLRVDEDCITAESVAVLRGMQLSSVEVDVLTALGRETSPGCSGTGSAADRRRQSHVLSHVIRIWLRRRATFLCVR